jgi:uncharacterized protein YoxC
MMPWYFSRKRFLAMEETLEKVQRDLKATTLEAENLYEKARSLLGRVVKRGALPSEPQDEPLDDVPAHLKHLDPVSRKIHMQRAARFTRGNGST